MFTNLLREIYYFFYDILIILKNLRTDKNFIVILPRLFSLFLKKVFIFDKLNKKLFVQYIRNKFDILTVFEIYAEENYSLKKYEISKKIMTNFEKNFRKNLKPLIIDCGSNIGSSTEYFYRIFKNSKVIGVEPNLQSLNFSKNNIISDDYLMINKAISCENKKVYLDNTLKDNRSSKISENKGDIVDTITVNELINYYGKDCHPFLIKIDIEGYEKDLFLKDYSWIDKFEIIIIEIHDWMYPNSANSYSFFSAMLNVMSQKNKRDMIISGENLISIKITS